MHIDRAIALYDPAKHRQLATRFGQDVRVALLFYRSLALWPLGYPEEALVDADRAIRDAREIGQAASLMAALTLTSLSHVHCGSFAIANAQLDEAITLANETGAVFWKVGGMLVQGCLFAITGKASDAVRTITSGLSSWRATGTTVWMPTYLSYLTRAHAELGQFDEASRSISEAIIAVQQLTKVGMKPISIALPEKSHYAHQRQMRRNPKRISSVRFRWRVSSRQSPGNCVQR